MQRLPDVVAARQMLAQADALLIDWDGCLSLGGRMQPGAIDLLDEWRDRVVILSNNSTHLPRQIGQMLKDAGLALPEERILLAGHETIRHVASQGPCRTMILGDTRLRTVARGLGLTLVRDAPDIVILLRDTRFTYGRLERAANAIAQGARLIVANADLTHPGPAGLLVPETGALLAALVAATKGRAADHELIGKPGPMLFRRACAVLGVMPDRAVMIGDNPDTDVAGAAAAGMPAILLDPATGCTLTALLGSAAPLCEQSVRRLRTA